MYQDLKIVKNAVQNGLDDGKSETEAYKEAYEFALSLLENTESDKIREYNNQIADGIHKLAINGQWSNLLAISKHAMTACVDTLDQDTNIKERLGSTLDFKLEILHMGKQEILPMLTEEAKQKYFNL